MVAATCIATTLEKRRPLPVDNGGTPSATSISVFLLRVVMLGAVLLQTGSPRGETRAS